MPELPEVEYAARRARRVLHGRRIVALRTHHPSQARALPERHARQAQGRAVVGVERRGKAQLILLDTGASLLVHFRMNGDWALGRRATALPPHARVSLDLDDGRRLTLVDSRALCRVTWHAASAPPRLHLGPEADDPSLTPADLRQRFGRKRGPLKPALMDQAVLAGIGNIYASEACWHAQVSPRARASSLTRPRAERLLEGLRAALADGHVNAGRYHRGERQIPFRVYDREGEPCDRCAATIRRAVQAGRSTYWCPRCQAR